MSILIPNLLAVQRLSTGLGAARAFGRGRAGRWLGAVGGAALLQASLSGCGLGGPEKICSDGEISVERSVHGPGSYCQAHKASDADCPPGQITRLILSTGREDCIIDEVGHERDGLPGPD